MRRVISGVVAVMTALAVAACSRYASASETCSDSMSADSLTARTYDTLPADDEDDNSVPATDTVRNRYHMAFTNENGLIIVGLRPDGECVVPNEWGLIDRTGKVIVDPEKVSLLPGHDKLGYMVFMSDEGYVAFRKKGVGCGVFNSDYKEVIKAGTYDDITLYGHYGLAHKKGDSRHIVIAIPSGKALGYVDKKYDVVDISEDMVLASIKDGDHYANVFLDVNGNVVIPASKLRNYYAEGGFSQGLAMVKDRKFDKKVGYIDKKGRLVIPFKYDDLFEIRDYGDSSFHREGIAFVAENGKVGAIDRKGNVVIPFDYDDLEFTPKGLVGYKWNDEKDDYDYYAVDTRGNVKAVNRSYVHPYKKVSSLRSYWDESTRLYGYKDAVGRVVIPAQYDYCMEFSNGIAIVGDATGRHLIDATGRILIRNLANCGAEMLPG